MKHTSISGHRAKFEALTVTRAAQAAIMILQPGATSDDDLSNEHPRCEQWLYVIAGSGTATVARSFAKRTIKLKTGSLLTIEKNELHQIQNTGSRPLRTLNIYVPPAYTQGGEVKASAKKQTKRSMAGDLLDKATKAVGR